MVGSCCCVLLFISLLAFNIPVAFCKICTKSVTKLHSTIQTAQKHSDETAMKHSDDLEMIRWFLANVSCFSHVSSQQASDETAMIQR